MSGSEECGKRIMSLYGKQAQVILADGIVHAMVPKHYTGCIAQALV